jgi:hypothetical protein
LDIIERHLSHSQLQVDSIQLYQRAEITPVMKGMSRFTLVGRNQPLPVTSSVGTSLFGKGVPSAVFPDIGVFTVKRLMPIFIATTHDWIPDREIRECTLQEFVAAKQKPLLPFLQK